MQLSQQFITRTTKNQRQMKQRLFNTLGSEYFKKRIEENEKRIEELDETLSEKHARLSGFYSGVISGLIADLEVHEKNQ